MLQQNIGNRIIEAFKCVQEDFDSRRENLIWLLPVNLMDVVVYQVKKNKGIIFYLKSKSSF